MTLIESIQRLFDFIPVADMPSRIMTEVRRYMVDRQETVSAIENLVDRNKQESAKIVLAYLTTLPMMREHIFTNLGSQEFHVVSTLGRVIIDNISTCYGEIETLVSKCNPQATLYPIPNPSFHELYAMFCTSNGIRWWGSPFEDKWGVLECLRYKEKSGYDVQILYHDIGEQYYRAYFSNKPIIEQDQKLLPIG